MKTTHTQRIQRTLGLTAIAAAVAMLAACNRADDNATVGQKVDSAIERAERSAQQTKDTTVAAADAAAQKMENAAQRAGEKMDNAAGAVSSKVEDAAITASVNAELAKDTQLSALRIDVDTAGGKVTLSGKAPDPTSRERATQLASAVKGVTSVDNRLQVGG